MKEDSDKTYPSPEELQESLEEMLRKQASDLNRYARSITEAYGKSDTATFSILSNFAEMALLHSLSTLELNERVKKISLLRQIAKK